MNYLKQLFKNVFEFAKAMSPSQAIVFLGIVAGIIVAMVIGGSWLGNVNYSVLYSNLDPSDAGEIAEYLSEEKISYKLSDGGSTISVPSGDVYKVRISLASQGMPRSGNVGYSIFDQSNLGMTEFLQNLNFRRALEGELMRTIMQLSDVEAARVHIVMPKDRLFKEDQQEATASVVLKLRRPTGLSESQIAGITHLVAASVEGLRPENISIIDYNGNLLSSRTDSDALAGLSTSQLEVRKNAEEYLEHKAQSMLDGVVGPGKSIVRVTAELDFQQVEKTSELFDPNSSVIRSEEKTEQTASASDRQEEVAESTDENRVETTVTNYEINKTVEHIVDAVGTVERISVAVLLDWVHREREAPSGTIEMVYEPRPQEEIDRITSIVKNAVGFDSQRSDQIEVVNIAFDRTSLEHDQNRLDQMIQREFFIDLAKKLGLVLLAALAFFFFRKKAKRFFTSLGRILPQSVPRRPTRQYVPEYAPSEQEEESEPVKPINAEKRQPTLIDQMQRTAKDNPDEFAKVIKTMMVD
ncbi:MAG: flagellar M-ring protein FliF [Candidatus Zixiibacteriota bacterium]|nr:MAG: flagellar M-ring protein FliF [candidate division Zixibacteria bacterium]